MRSQDFTEKKTGQLIEIMSGYRAFVPDPLPPALSPTWEIGTLLSEAERALGQLAGLARNLPNPNLLIGPFARKEAVLSSRIEGTQTTLSELLLFEESGVDALQQTERQKADVREVANYVTALEYGLQQVAQRSISLMLLREIHEILMQGVRGKDKAPGQFRDGQNHIGPPGSTLATATYVPPPPLQMRDCLDAFEKFLRESSPLPPLVRLALIHYQFEAIHPFMDGNGRIGRLLIILLLCQENRFLTPLLYLSGYFERNRDRYYDLLLAVSQSGVWEEWITFFLRGVVEQSHEVFYRSEQLLTLREDYRNRLHSMRSPTLAYELIDALFIVPTITVKHTQRRLGRTPHAIQNNIDRLVVAGILEEATGRERNRIYVAPKILEIIEAEKPGE